MVLDYGRVLDKRTLIEKREDALNKRKEATQLTNPTTGNPVYISNDLRDNGSGVFYGPNQIDYTVNVERFEDPIQAHLRAMEEREPSLNEHKQGCFSKQLGDRLTLVDRALQYRNGTQHIWRERKGERQIKFKVNILELKLFDSSGLEELNRTSKNKPNYIEGLDLEKYAK